MTVAVWRVAASAGTVAVVVPVVTAVRVPPCSPGRVVLQEVRMGGRPGWPGGCWDLDLARAFHSLQRDREGMIHSNTPSL